jgi:hypothetical protein
MEGTSGNDLLSDSSLFNVRSCSTITWHVPQLLGSHERDPIIIIKRKREGEDPPMLLVGVSLTFSLTSCDFSDLTAVYDPRGGKKINVFTHL